MIPFQVKLNFEPNKIIDFMFGHSYVYDIPFGVNYGIVECRIVKIVIDQDFFFRSRPRLKLQCTILSKKSINKKRFSLC